MARLDPIQYAERLYGAICAANFSPISFLAFGNAVKEGVGMRNLPRIAAEPFMRVVGEMLSLEEEVVEQELVDGTIVETPATQTEAPAIAPAPPPSGDAPAIAQSTTDAAAEPAAPTRENDRRRGRR
jgi:hypothetical protein